MFPKRLTQRSVVVKRVYNSCTVLFLSTLRDTRDTTDCFHYAAIETCHGAFTHSRVLPEYYYLPERIACRSQPPKPTALTRSKSFPTLGGTIHGLGYIKPKYLTTSNYKAARFSQVKGSGRLLTHNKSARLYR